MDDLEAEAKRNKKGLRTDKSPINPFEWRKGREELILLCSKIIYTFYLIAYYAYFLTYGIFPDSL